MKKNILLFLLFAGITEAGYSSGDPLAHHRHFRKIYFFDYGMPAYDRQENNSCADNVRDQFGFDYKRKAGCEVSYFQDWRYERHNNHVERKLKRRFGADWEEKYAKCVEECSADKSNKK